jgi:hypothetical protein
MDWKIVIPIVISGLALLVSGLSLIISFLAYRRAVQMGQPLLTAELTPVQEQAGWFQLNLRLENRSTRGWRCEDIRFETWSSRGLTWRDAQSRPDLYGDQQLINTLPKNLARGRLSLHMEVTTVEPNTTKTLFVFVPSYMWRRTLNLRASLRSKEPVERTEVVSVV